MKNEPYYSNSLSRFLLTRALKSQRVGFDLFWHLRSEINNLKYKFKFGVILEAYCRGIGIHLKDLIKQVEVVEKLSVLAQEIKSNSDSIALVKVEVLLFFINKDMY